MWGSRSSHVITLDTSAGLVGITVSNNEVGPGVRIERVQPGDLAARAGLRAGDVVLALYQREQLEQHPEGLDVEEEDEDEQCYYDEARVCAKAAEGFIKLQWLPDGEPFQAHYTKLRLLCG